MAYQSQLKKLRSPNLRIYVGVFLAIFLIMFILFHYANRTEELYQLHRRPDLGGFQLEFVSISQVIDHMTCNKFECSYWLKLQHSDWRANLVNDFFLQINFPPMRALKSISSHVIYSPAYTYKFQLKTT